jgi:hypothetical protein
VRVYWHVAHSSFQRYLTYRFTQEAGLFTNLAFGLLQAARMIALL